jgi:carboxypeptidase T
MPPSGYLTATGIESCLQYLATTYPAICSLIPMPETSIEGRTIRAIKVASGSGADRHGVLLIGGVHARELVNPDLLVSFALKLCQAYTGGSNLTFGPKTYDASTVQLLVNSLDIFILPLVNPDGRIYVQAPGGDAWWRKNRNLNPSQPCMGVDINRNYDFLWSSGIGTSASSCSEVFKGTGAFSEPETRNVRHMLDTYANIECFADVHSYSQLILHPWGDDDNQTTDPSMNFRNPIYNGLRGTPGDSAYKEYIPPGDLSWHVSTGTRIRDSIAAIRGRVYTIEQGVLLYPTSGTSEDYAYSRHFVDATDRRVYGYVIETGTEFQPVYAEALNIISEVSAGLVELLLACLCVVEETITGTALAEEIDDMRAFRDRDLARTAVGRRYVQLLDEHGGEAMQLLRSERRRSQAVELLERIQRVVRTRHAPKPERFPPDLLRSIAATLREVQGQASEQLGRAIQEVIDDLGHFEEKTVMEGLEAASKARS